MCAFSYKSKSWQARFPQSSSSSTLTSLPVSLLCCFSNAWPDSHKETLTLTFSLVMCVFQAASCRKLVLLSSFAVSALIAHAAVFCTVHPTGCLSFEPCADHCYPEDRVSSPDQWCWSSHFALTDLLLLCLFLNKVLVLLVETWNASLAVPWRFIFSCRRPAWRQVFTTTNINLQWIGCSFKHYCFAQLLLESRKRIFFWNASD